MDFLCSGHFKLVLKRISLSFSLSKPSGELLDFKSVLSSQILLFLVMLNFQSFSFSLEFQLLVSKLLSRTLYCINDILLELVKL